MKTYAQYCPIARASEILAQRWTPIIIRNLLNGPSSYTELVEQAPGVPRSLLTSRLRQLEAAGLVQNSSGGPKYSLTEPGRDLGHVIEGMGEWGERWLDVTPQHADPVYFLNSWVNTYLNTDALPTRRVVARFEFTDQPARLKTMWVLFHTEHSEVCKDHPGFDEDVVVKGESVGLAEWHLGRTEWSELLQTDRVAVTGLPKYARALPSWNRRSRWVDTEHPR